MRYAALSLLLVGCGYGPKSSTHTVQGEATVRVVVEVDVSVCNELPQEDRAECIKNIIELAKSANAAKEQEPEGFGGIR
jgi:hypothetical protein